MRIWSACEWLHGIFTAVPVNVIEPLRLGVVGLDILVTNRPGRGDPAVTSNLTEICFSEAEQGGPIKFRIATDIVVGVRVELLSVLVMPHLFSLIFSFEIDGARVPVIFFARNVAAALKEKNLFACRGELMRQRAAASAGAYDDHIVMVLRKHFRTFLIRQIVTIASLTPSDMTAGSIKPSLIQEWRHRS